jgi:uncharacterized protein (UPF0264 family)
LPPIDLAIAGHHHGRGVIEGLRRGRPAFLASVTSAAEAELALRGGADVIDCKDPAAGALGALDRATVREIVRAVSGRAPVSATIGDLPADPEAMLSAATAMAATGIDVVKIGLFGDRDPRPAIAALGGAEDARDRLVAVLMADRDPDFTLLPVLAEHGFRGTMLDTAGKSSGSLTDVLSIARLAEFVTAAHAAGLFAGLAGSLQAVDVAKLQHLGADILGFRGALCVSGRASGLDVTRISAIRGEIERARTAAPARERSVA